jgi:predicted transcriptional regulator of viral defense system
VILFEFLERVKPMGIFSIGELELLYPGLDKRRLYEWQLKNYIIKLRNGWYCLPEFLRENYSTWIIANAVHEPSYLSLESALSYHGIIPEGVYMTTSLTTNRTIRLSMAGSSYAYSSVKNELFFGYELIETGYHHRKIRMADPVKALIDFFYLHPDYNTEDEILQLRLNRPALREGIPLEKLELYLTRFKNLKLEKRISTMLHIYDHD